MFLLWISRFYRCCVRNIFFSFFSVISNRIWCHRKCKRGPIFFPFRRRRRRVQITFFFFSFSSSFNWWFRRLQFCVLGIVPTGRLRALLRCFLFPVRVQLWCRMNPRARARERDGLWSTCALLTSRKSPRP